MESSFKFQLISLSLSLKFQFSNFEVVYLQYTDMIRDNNKMKYNFFFVDDADTNNKKINDVNTEKLKGTLKKQK